MRSKLSRCVTLLAVAGALTACASTGALQGRLEVAGRPAVPVSIAFKSDVFGDGGTLATTLPTGECFSGKCVQVVSTVERQVIDPVLAGWDGSGNWGPFGNDPWFDGDYTTFVTTYSGKVIANLFGDQGHTMRCRFRRNDAPRA